VFESFKKKNNSLLLVLGGALLFLGLIVYVPFLRNLFHFGFMHPVDILIAVSAGIANLIWIEIIKLVKRKSF
jgi:Ca2+-transporting ATPase